MSSSKRHLENIALIGFMGTGKSTVGRLLAEYLRFAFLDTDELIESRAGKKDQGLMREFIREVRRAERK